MRTRRLLAYCIDALAFFGLLLLAPDDWFHSNFLMVSVVSNTSFLAYRFVGTATGGRASIGKRLLGLRVSPDGPEVPKLAMMWRRDSLGIALGAGAVVIAATDPWLNLANELATSFLHLGAVISAVWWEVRGGRPGQFWHDGFSRSYVWRKREAEVVIS